MHEFSLAQNIIEIVTETAASHHTAIVSEVVLEIGTLSGVEIPALEMALESLAPGSIIEKALIKKNIIPAEALCKKCGHRYSPEEIYSCCPECDNFSTEIIRGKELKVASITTE